MGTQNELDKVHDLYIMQIELWKVLDGHVRGEKQLTEARKRLRQFTKLLTEVDWRYMGGEDVYQTLEEMGLQADRKLRAKAEQQTRKTVKAVAKKPGALSKKRK